MKTQIRIFFVTLLLILSFALPVMSQHDFRDADKKSLEKVGELKSAILVNPYDSPESLPVPFIGGPENTTELELQCSFSLPSLMGKAGIESICPAAICCCNLFFYFPSSRASAQIGPHSKAY